MQRISAPNGSKINLESLVSSLQEKSFNNLTNRLSEIFSNFGLTLDTNTGTPSTTFNLTVSGSNLSLSPGRGITPAGQYIVIDTPKVVTNLSQSNVDTIYALVLTYEELGSDPVKATNAFVYDALGAASLSRKTVFTDSCKIELLPITTTITALKATLTSNQLALFAVRNTAGGSNPTSAGINNYEDIGNASYNIFDLRPDIRLILNENVIPDSMLLFKERDSVGELGVTGDVEFKGDLKLSGTTTLPTSLKDYTLQPNGDKLELISPDGTLLEIIEEEGTDKIKIAKLLADDIKVFDGEAYREVIIAGPNSTVPRNLRIFDIYPTEDKNERKGFVEIRWNWDDLNVVNGGLGYVDIANESYKGESISFTAADLSTYLPGKRLYFSGSDSSYIIDSVTSPNAGQYRISLIDETGVIAGSETSVDFPARIIDTDVEYYRVKFIASNQQNRTVKEIISVELGAEFVKTPAYTTKLELGKEWYATIQAVNNYSFSPIITMPAGSYDPDGALEVQPVVEYESPFLMALPPISTGGGSLALTATTSGFNVLVSGWSGGSNQTRFHELELLWSYEEEITEATFDIPALPNTIQRRIISGYGSSIFSPIPARYSVAVRPLQNKQGVAAPIIKNVTSGGGGVVPEEQTLYQSSFDIRTTKFKVMAKDSSTDNTYSCRAFNPVTDLYELIPERSVLNKSAVFPTITDLTPTNFTNSNDFTYTASSAGVTITPSYVGKTAPAPGVIKFTAGATTSNSAQKTNESAWAKAVLNSTINLTAGEGVSVNFLAHMSNWGEAILKAELQDTSNDEVLVSKVVEKRSGYPEVENNLVTLSYDNKDATSKTLRLVLKGYVNLANPASPLTGNNVGIIILADWFFPYFQQTTFNSQGAIFGGVSFADSPNASFGLAAEPFSITKDSVISSNNSKEISRFRTTLQGGTIEYVFTFKENTDLSVGDFFYIGVSPEGRFIFERDLEVDYEVTRVEADIKHVDGLSATYPGIIRVYANDDADSGVNLEIQGASRYLQKVNLPIQADGSSRKMFIDAFDGSQSPNNRAEMSGGLLVVGKPKILNRLN